MESIGTLPTQPSVSTQTGAGAVADAADGSDAILVFAMRAIGDFVRSHTLVRLLRERYPSRPIDIVGRAPAIELAPFMEGVRLGIAEPFGKSRLHLSQRRAFARQLRGKYQTAYVISRSWKAALVPFLAGIPERVGWFGEFRYPLVNRPRFGDLRMPRMVDRIGGLGCGPSEPRTSWPAPRLVCTPEMLTQWRQRSGEAPSARPIIGMAPGSSDVNKNWPPEAYAALALWAEAQGTDVWLLGGQDDRAIVDQVRRMAGGRVRDMTDLALAESTYRLAAADTFVGNDSGLLHIAAALGKPSVGIFTSTRPFVAAPINSQARVVIPPADRILRTYSTSQAPDFETVREAVEGALKEHRNLG
jgi:heptosyltransferase-2